MVGERRGASSCVVGDLIARITVQTCRQSGLSVVYTELLDFGGDEIYFHEEPALVGKTFGEALLAYEDSAVIGLRCRGRRRRCSTRRWTRAIAAGDQVIVISEDDDTVRLSGRRDRAIDAAAIQRAGADAADARAHADPRLEPARRRRSSTSSTTTSRPGSTSTVVADATAPARPIARDCAEPAAT